MRINVSLDTQAVITQPSPVRVKAGGFVPVEVAFTRGSQPAGLPEGASLAFVLKPKGQLTGGTLVLHSDFSAAPGGVYLGMANFHTQPLMALLGLSDDVSGNDAAQLEAVAELAWTIADQRFASSSFPVFVEAPLRREDEATPAALPDLKANQAEAEAGADNAKWMTPLRTAQAIAALAGGGSYVLKQASFQAESGMRYLVGVSPAGAGAYGSTGENASLEGSSGSVGSAETEIVITLPANPRPADAIVVLDAFGNWSPTNFGQSGIPVFIRPNGKPLNGSDLPLHWLPCSSILAFSNDAVGWRITRIETGRHLDLGHNSTLDLCNQYPDGVMLHNSRGEAYPRFIVRHSSGSSISFGMLPSGNPVIEPSENRTLRIGQFPLAIRAAAFELLNGHQINVPIHNPSSADMAVFRGMDNWSDPNLLGPGTLYYEKADGKVKMVVQNPRPLTITLTGTTHNWYAGHTFDLNGNYGWKYSATSSGPAATFAAPVYQHPAINGAQIRFANNRWALYVDNVEYAYCDVWGSPVYPIGYNWLLKATNEGTDFSISWDESIKRWIPLDNSAP